MPDASSETAPGGLWFIDTPPALERLAGRLEGRTYVPIDTEFERRKTYYAELCLVQIGLPDGCACVDPLACGSVAPLAAALAAPGRVSVMHSARQDLEVLQQAGGTLPGRVLDTQIAAALAGHAEQIGYADLVEQRLGVTLAKSETRTDWRRRPLSPAQLDYAADDVRYLEPLRESLCEALERLGRLAWLEEECLALLDPALYAVAPEDAWQRVKGIGRLPDPVFARAASLAAWRERHAQRADLPRGWVLKDPDLLALAAQAPGDLAALEAGGQLGAGLLRRHGEALLAALQAPPPAPQRPPQRSPDETEKRAVKALASAVRERAAELEVPASLLLTRREIEQLATGRVPARVVGGWRADVLRDLLPDDTGDAAA